MKNILLLFLLFSTVAWAQPREKREGHVGGRMMEKLNLTDDQRKQVGKLHSDLQKKQIALRSKVQTLRVDVRDSFREEKPDRGKIELKLTEITKLQGEMKTNHVAFWFDVNKALTPEQQKIWKEAPMMMHRGYGEGMRRGVQRHRMGTMDEDPEEY